MSKVTTLHNSAMSLAAEGLAAREAGNTEVARALFREAFETEREAAMLLVDDLDSEPTRSVLLRSAARLAIDCGQPAAAETLVALGLSGRPPTEIDKELRDIWLEIAEPEWQLALEGIVALGHGRSPLLAQPVLAAALEQEIGRPPRQRRHGAVAAPLRMALSRMDERALEAACRALIDAGLAYFRDRLTRSQIDLAEELAAQAVACALLSPQPWTGHKRTSFRAWFHAICEGRYQSYLRQLKRDRDAKAALRNMARSRPAPRQEPDQIVGEEGFGAEIRQFAREWLSPREASILVSHGLDGLSIRDICQVLGLRPDTVRRHWRNARAVFVLVYYYIQKGMSEAEIARRSSFRATPSQERQRLCRALSRIRGRPGAVELAHRLVAEKGWSLGEIARAWRVGEAELRRLLARDSDHAGGL